MMKWQSDKHRDDARLKAVLALQRAVEVLNQAKDITDMVMDTEIETVGNEKVSPEWPIAVQQAAIDQALLNLYPLLERSASTVRQADIQGDVQSTAALRNLLARTFSAATDEQDFRKQIAASIGEMYKRGGISERGYRDLIDVHYASLYRLLKGEHDPMFSSSEAEINFLTLEAIEGPVCESCRDRHEPGRCP
jgi:hypothetical protein